ncbi:efflux RND transporter permease subunit [Fulvivirga sp. M361]|uniref:efflux RND transporter permease subunit n=1 Tax=Fulvivirga sp. M361 TaxID=2594266 RepID=UPI00117BD85E|nr:efflux RND transporter permease subunit [Fulvivirga sp. M361]TRX59576.1 efflux RND transporter permease subunit [Fulvivirga sp. M361]
MLNSVKGLVEYFVKYPILANIIIALTLIGGIASFFGTKKSFFPSRKINNISILVAYPGASPEEMEEGVTTKIEESITSIAGIDEVNSNSSENNASISITVLENYDIDEVYTEVKNAVDAISSFPQDAEKPVIYKIKPTTPSQWLAITGDVDLYTLKKYGERIEDDLLASGVVSQLNLMGFNDREISIEVTENDLRRYGITFDQVASAVRLNNLDISAGSIKSTSEEILIRSKAKETDAELIGDIVLKSNEDGSKLLLRDIGTIKEQFADVPNKWTINGQRAVFVQVLKLEDEDLQEISEYINTYADEFNASNSVVQLIVSFDFMDYLNQRLEMLTTNGMIGLLLVLVALGLFLSIRLSAWVAWGIPSSFLGMFILGAFFGLTINMISLFGMILVIGILVDDGIVIAENIYSHFEKTGNPIKAAVNGTMEVLPAVTTSVTTTIVAFMPLFFLTGGFEFLKDMAFVVVASLSFSLLEAFFVLPAHLASKSVLSVKSEDTRSFKIRKQINRFVDWMRYDLYGNALKYTMKYRVISVCTLIALFPIMGGLFGGGFIKSTFFPNIPFTNFEIDIAFKPGTREQVTEGYLRKFENIVWEVNDELKEQVGDGKDIMKFTFSGLGSTSDGGDNGSHAGQISVFYRELDGTGINEYDIINGIRDKIGEVPDAEKLLVGGQNRFGKPISIRLLGADYDELQRARDDLKNELRKITQLKDVQDNVQIGRREMLFDLKPEAYFMGLTHSDITSQVRQGFFGEEVQRLQKGSDEVRVWVRYPEGDRISVTQLEDMKVKVNDSEFPLTQLTDYDIERGLSGIRHYNAKRAITVEADMVDPFGEVPPILKDVQENIIPKVLQNYTSVEVDYGGQSKESERAQSQIGLFFGGAFLLIFFILMLTFKSFYQAVMIIAMIPLGWIGASIGHGIEGLPVSLLSAWGMIALSGVIINDAVVFLAKFNTLVKEEKQGVYQAAYNAGLARFRPIMLTSITTVAGLWPLIMEKSFQAQFLIPMAVSVAYGVLIGTFIILLFFPVIILFFNDVRRYAKWLWTGTKPEREDVERVLIDERRLEQYRESA